MNKKQILVDTLRKTKEPLSLSQLYAILGEGFPPRSLRRYLDELCKDQKVDKFGGKKNRRYLARDQQLSAFPIGHRFFCDESLAVLKRLEEPLYERAPRSYSKDWLISYVPNHDYYLTVYQRAILHEHGAQTLDDQPAGTVAQKIYTSLLIDLSYNSSRLEGNTYSLADTKELILAGKSAPDKLDAEKVMILNHKEAIKYLVENNNNNVNVSETTIRTLHYLLSDGLVLPEHSGIIRNEQVKVSGSVYIPLDDNQQIQEILTIIIGKANEILDSYEQSVFLLVHLSYLQSFIDVNKRTARLACNIPLIKNNLTPISFNDIHVGDYRSAIIAIYEFNQALPIIDLYIWSYIRSSDQYKAIIQSMGYDAMRVKYRQQRRELLRDIIKGKIKTNLEHFISSFAEKYIPSGDRSKFKNDMFIDLEQLDEAKIVGLGVTKEEFQTWFKDQ